MTTGNDVDLANEIGGLIRRLKVETPAISNDEIANILIAAYCPVVAQTANASPAAKWHLMRTVISMKNDWKRMFAFQ